jgi:hypothetical protein
MVRVFAAVSLSDCNITHQDTSTSYSGPAAFGALQSVFRSVVGAPPHSESEGRAKKRRKLPNGAHADVQDSFDPTKSAVLARITLDLVSSYPQPCTTPRYTAHGQAAQALVPGVAQGSAYTGDAFCIWSNSRTICYTLTNLSRSPAKLRRRPRSPSFRVPPSPYN